MSPTLQLSIRKEECTSCSDTEVGACSGMVSCHDIAMWLQQSLHCEVCVACLPQTPSDRVFVHTPF